MKPVRQKALHARHARGDETEPRVKGPVLGERASGVLLHPTSLPGPHGSGDLGEEARRFIDFLAAAGQRYWQMLPVGPPGYGNSPYSAHSAFAGSPSLISPEGLCAEGWLTQSDLAGALRDADSAGPQRAGESRREAWLRLAYTAFQRRADRAREESFQVFCAENERWLTDYALYTALKAVHGGAPWTAWDPALRDRRRRAMAEARQRYRDEMRFHSFTQYVFAEQFRSLRAYAAARGVALIGDIPIFVAHDSADVWQNPELFWLDERGAPLVVAGVPPDYFSKTGQRWGNPLYRWKRIAKTGYAFWVQRLRITLARFDVVRLDHFIGFQRYWEIPASCTTAVEGRWVKGPGARLFKAMERALGPLPLFAEDLGVVTRKVKALRKKLGLPGIRVLQFAFGDDPSAPDFLPHNYPRRAVVYTGTHDNDTTAGWFHDRGDSEEHALARADRSRASGRSCVSRRGRPGDPLGHDPGCVDVGREHGDRPGAGLARARVGGAHEPARESDGKLGVSPPCGRARRGRRGAPREAHPGVWPLVVHERGEGAAMKDEAPQSADLRRAEHGGGHDGGGDSGDKGAQPAALRSPIPILDRRSTEPDWYKDAIIYELRIRSFFDADGDGIGDIKGLTEKLDYLQDLGVTAIWLLPFYPSPLRDDGYDISDYGDIHPEVGAIADLKELLVEAHRRGLHVITELVLNHTSDQHPWFQRARRAPQGSAARDFYVWSDTADRYRDARIIFKDFEHSNWSWDPVARAYYWHRFYAHQPDLNFDNPAVHEALLSVVDFWFDLGVDGLRLDAVPYLYEREGTTSENLPETHAFLKKLRAHVDARHKGRMLLAEANQWPEDAAAYFGAGDECHMAFHFPIMPRLFMAIHLEDRFPLVDILAQTPALADGCQWALFLRNHDELTLEMVTDEERDYMYRAYARDQAMRINLGIRRRLAPLLGNDRRLVELMNGLLFSLPGTPVVYYGDEIGMGDNVFLGDRNGVRTPMQWSSDRNAGFSRANPQRLILPVILDPEYHFESLNVEAQQNNPNSLLWWMKRLIALRKRFIAFGRGTIEFLNPENHRVLAFIRRHGDEVILVVANLSRFVQFVELDLSREKGRVPVELSSGNALPEVRDLPYLLTLGGHAFYWFALKTDVRAESALRVESYKPPLIEVRGPWDRALSGEGRERIIRAASVYVESRPWFGSRGSLAEVASAGAHGKPLIAIADAIQIATGNDAWPSVTLLIGATTQVDGDRERYLLPIAMVPEERAAAVRARSPQAIVAEVRGASGAGVIIDAFADAEASRVLLETIASRGSLRGASGVVVGKVTAPARSPSRDDLQIEPRSLRVRRASPLMLFGDPFFANIYRRLDEGTSPDLEVARFLADRSTEGFVPAFAGAVEYRPDRGEPMTMVVLRAFVANEGDAFSRCVEEVGRYFERVLTQRREAPLLADGERSLLALSAEAPRAAVRELVGAYLDTIELLGKRTAELHLALAGGAAAVASSDGAQLEAAPSSRPAAFAPEPYSLFDQRSTYQTMRNQAGKVLRALGLRQRALPPVAALDAESILLREGLVMRRFAAVLSRRLTAPRVRYHGNYNLRKVLFTGKDFVLADFEGDPRRPLPDRRRKGTVIRDLATMIRSFSDASLTALFDETRVRMEDRAALEPWAHVFYTSVSAAFLHGYFKTAGQASFLPVDPRETELLLDAFLLKRAFTDLGVELEVMSDRVLIPLRGIVRLLEEPLVSSAPTP